MADQEVETVDVVVVGSGFGGSVTAYRLAEAGRSVVVLERGRAWPPGSFARTPHEMSTNFWDPSEGTHGLFDVWSFGGLDGVVSSGLGGGSLIYANVLLRKDEHWFVHESPLPGGGYENWPVSRADLEPHYDEVEKIIGTTRYPYQDTAKTNAMEYAAGAAGLDIQRPPLAITFAATPGDPPQPRAQLPEPEFGNIHDLPRLTCRLCGECDLGCNDGAKNTLDHTYLSRARHLGADIRTRSEVRGLRPLPGGGYEVQYVEHAVEADQARDTSTMPLRTVRCTRLVLGAGTFGTSYLLLRSRSAFPALSDRLGSRFSGNGDLLTFLLNATGEGGEPRRLEGSRGPVITTAVRVPDEADGAGATGRGHYVQDAGFPGFTNWLVETSQVGAQARRAITFAAHLLADRADGSSDTSLGAELGGLIGDGTVSSTSLPLLGMGRDIPNGQMSLNQGRLALDWTTDRSMDYFEGVRSTMKSLAEKLGADYLDNPMWLARRVITAHPLGGAPMGVDARDGVCDSFGRVFGYPGLYVVDGSLMPGPVGANPSLTIAALADRAADAILEEPAGGQVVSASAPATASQPAAEEEPVAGTTVSFTEKMRGFVALGVDDPVAGRERGKAQDQRLMFELTITTRDVDRFVEDADHEGTAIGYLESDLLGGRFEVERGWFNLFVEEDDPTTRKMRYRLWFTGPGGNPMTFTGEKVVHQDPGLDLWRDTSTLYVRILEGHRQHDEPAPVAAAGVITIHIPDFMRQLTTFRAEGARPVHGLSAFGRLFLGELWDVYGTRLVEDIPADAP